MSRSPQPQNPPGFQQGKEHLFFPKSGPIDINNAHPTHPKRCHEPDFTVASEFLPLADGRVDDCIRRRLSLQILASKIPDDVLEFKVSPIA